MCVAHDSFSYTLHFTLLHDNDRYDTPITYFLFSLFDKPVSANGGWDGDTVLLFTLWGWKNLGEKKGGGRRIWGENMEVMVMVMATLLRMASNGWRRTKKGG